MSRPGCVPSEPFVRVMADWMVRNGGLKALAKLLDKDDSNLVKLMKRDWIGFDTADRIVCAIDPFLRINDEEIRAIYDDFDLAWLDLTRPCAA